MTAVRDIPRSVRWTVPLSLLGLALAVPFSAPDGTGMQWDELVLGGAAASSAWTLLRLARPMHRIAGDSAGEAAAMAESGAGSSTQASHAPSASCSASRGREKT